MIQRINTYGELELSWVLPSAINLTYILEENKPAFNYNIHYFYHLIDIICDKMEYLDLDDENQWVHLSSTKLREFNKHYRKYITYLHERGIICLNPSYKKNERCKGFKLTPKYYDGIPTEIALNRYKDSVIWKNAKGLKGIVKEPRKRPEPSPHEHLTKWFNDKLQIVVDGAHREIEQIFPRYGRVKTSGAKGEILRKKTDGKFKALRAVKRIASCDYFHHVDDNIGRFHSNLTGLKKELRDYITYDGKKLVNLDIKNSQPLLSGVLLNPNFYQSGENFNIYSFNSLHTLLNNKLSHFNKSLQSLPYSIMLTQSQQTLIQTEFQEYLELVQSGKSYEMLSELIYPGKEFDRKKIKETTYIIFFCDNRHGSKARKIEQPFIDRFPNIHALFCGLKKYNKKVLSHVLQRLESHVVIERATRRIAQERPDLPIFTIHDSITTTVGDEDYVEQVLKEEIKAITGLNACIGREYWSEDKEAINANISPLNKAV